MDVRVDQARKHVLAAHVDLVVSAIRSVAGVHDGGDLAAIDHEVGAPQLVLQDQPPAAYDEIGSLHIRPCVIEAAPERSLLHGERGIVKASRASSRKSPA